MLSREVNKVMLEYLKPLISLYKIFIEGLKKYKELKTSEQTRELQRGIIEVQLTLEDIIDRGEEILASIRKLQNKKRITKGDVEPLRKLVYRQNHKIKRLLYIMSDSDEIMKLFTPKARRAVLELIHFKGGFIIEVMWRLSDFDDLKASGNKLTLMTRQIDWNHEAFIKDSHKYYKKLKLGPKKQVTVNQDTTIKEQQKILDDLIECSKAFSNFIREQIKLNDITLR